MTTNSILNGLRSGHALALAMFALAACSPSPTPIPPTQTPSAAATSPVLASPLASREITPPASPAATSVPTTRAPATIVPKSAVAGLGRVIGRAVLPPGREKHPSFVVSGEIYLGQFVPASDPKMPPAIAVSPVSAPHAQIDQNTGDFVFSDVAPGTYALVMIGFSDSFVFEKPNGGGRIEVLVVADKTTDLGNVTLK